ncbi:S8 family serine peptidase [candidate division KSB1 bacterium]
MKKILSIYVILITSFFLLFFYLEPDNVQKYWIIFDTKDISLNKVNSSADFQAKIVSKRSLQRRMKVKPVEELIDEKDLPVSETYISRLQKSGIKIVNRSRWLNAVTAYLTKEQLDTIKELKFVKKVDPVRRFKKSKPIIQKITGGIKKITQPTEDVYSYGSSYAQNSMHNIHELHNLGITGKGALVGFLDTGYRLNHEAFQNIKVIAEYDFIFNDNNTDNEAIDASSQKNHGTYTLSNVGGFTPGTLIGVAFDAEFALAKTEDVRSEMPSEEDFWVAGLEWLDSLGCDVINSSLGYAEFDDGSGYTQADLDGQTAKTTIAADLAVLRGMVVVNSAGNERQDPWGTINTPADGFHVLAIGAVDGTGSLYAYSSPGPTADGRIKPDICAKSQNVSAHPDGYTSYTYVGGTSLSAPIACGAVALMVSANPSLNPTKIANALKNTASQAATPDNDYGWGIIDAYDALFYEGTIFIPDYTIREVDGNFHIDLKILTSNGIDQNSIYLHYSTDSTNFSTINMTQSSEANVYTAQLVEFNTGQNVIIYFSAVNTSNGSTEYFPKISENRYLSFVYGDTLLSADTEFRIIPKSLELKQNYPNPFNMSTKIRYNLPSREHVKIEIYNLLGQKVRTLLNNVVLAGTHAANWDGRNETGSRVSSGIYIYRLSAGSFSHSKKMVLLK